MASVRKIAGIGFAVVEGFLSALLLTTIHTAAVSGEPEYSTLIYGNSKEYKTIFYGAHLLGELAVPGKGPILVYSGTPSLPCALPDCDPETTVYFQSTSEEAGMTGWSLSYPGDYYASESGELVARVRMFIGHCIDAREGVAWFIENLEKSPPPYNSLLRSQVVFEFVNESHSDAPLGAPFDAAFRSPRLVTEWPTHRDISVARTAVANHLCKEIAPRPRIYRSVAEYLGPEIQISH